MSAWRAKASCAAGDGEIDLAGTDRARRIADRVEPRSAQPVHRNARNGIRQAREKKRHARNVAIVLAGLVGAADNHLVERRPVGLRIALHQRPDRDGGEIVRPHLRQRAAIAADGGAGGVAEKYVTHLVFVLPALDPSSRSGRAAALEGCTVRAVVPRCSGSA
jgi:hypothetical protein